MRKRSLYAAGIAIILLGAGAFSFMVINSMGEMLPGERFVAPGSRTIDLPKADTYYIFYESKGYINSTWYIGDDIGGLHCLLRSEKTGELVDLRPARSIRYELEGRRGEAIYRFNIDDPGEYKITAKYHDGGDKVILGVGRSDFVMVLIGSILILIASMIIGIVLIVWGSRLPRSRRK